MAVAFPIGIGIALVEGVVINYEPSQGWASSTYLVQRSYSPDFTHLKPGRFGPYAAVLVFSTGSFISNLVFNSHLMAHAIQGGKVTYSE